MVDDVVATRRTDLRREVRRHDPEWDRDSKRPEAYRFSNNRIFLEKEGSSYQGPWISEWRVLMARSGEPLFTRRDDKIDTR